MQCFHTISFTREGSMKYWFGCTVVILAAVQLQVAQTVSYSSDVRPIFESYGCLECHGGTNGLFLGTYAQVFTTGNHQPVVVPGDTNSILVLKLKGTAGFGARMPQGGAPMAAQDLTTIITWIKNGAPENSTSVVRLNETPFLRTFELKQNYPNPFNPSTTIQFTVPVSGNVRLSMYDAAGKEIATLIDQSMDAGTYSYNFKASSLPSGAYFYRLETGNNTLTKKLILTK